MGFFQAIPELFEKLFAGYSLPGGMGAPRSPKWRAVAREHLKNNPLCAACGTSENVVPHHIIPVHEDASRELDPANLVTLCNSNGTGCHFFLGHLQDWKLCNPSVIEDARAYKVRFSEARISRHPIK